MSRRELGDDDLSIYAICAAQTEDKHKNPSFILFIIFLTVFDCLFYVCSILLLFYSFFPAFNLFLF